MNEELLGKIQIMSKDFLNEIMSLGKEFKAEK
jgi:hypothetical protein